MHAAPDAWWTGGCREFLDTPRELILGQLTHEMAKRFRVNEHKQVTAWGVQIRVLREALVQTPDPEAWHVVFEFTPPRMQRRSDVILLHPGGIVLLEFKTRAQGYDHSACEQANAAALDLQDFHLASRQWPIFPILVAVEANARPCNASLPFGLAHPLYANGKNLGRLLRDIDALLPRPTPELDPHAWLNGAYYAMPGIIDAACTLYARHNVADIQSARADAENLTRTTDTITTAIAQVRETKSKLVLFVTGIPGAGKTLCGLNIAFAAGLGATFLTGNPTLVHVLREALARSQAQTGNLAAQRRKMKGKIQALPTFRNEYASQTRTPAEQVIIIDEAQRCWSEAYAVLKTRDKHVPLQHSEPTHLLDAMARHQGFAAVICLVGNGQEIHDGEGGLAEWSRALATRPIWRIACAAQALADPVPRQRLDPLPGVRVLEGLHLTVAMRALRNAQAPAWVDAVLQGDVDAARAIAARGRLPFRLTRSLDGLRKTLRQACHPGQRCGLVAAATAKRLRAEGLGAELPHMDADAVAHWFLDRYPSDIRASDALDTVATQFSVQGLELDHVGLCWGGDLIRRPDDTCWQARRLSGTKWQTVISPERVSNLLNTYRVLLTRARYDTLIWVPQGDAVDATRDPNMYDAIAAFLTRCGVQEMAPDDTTAASDAMPTLFREVP